MNIMSLNVKKKIIDYPDIQDPMSIKKIILCCSAPGQTCAHRYKKHRTASQRTNWGFGKCHTFTNRLDYDMEWDACSQLSVVGGHEDYGYCQAGTSGIIADVSPVYGYLLVLFFASFFFETISD